jgi:hypothetical protein
MTQIVERRGQRLLDGGEARLLRAVAGELQRATATTSPNPDAIDSGFDGAAYFTTPLAFRNACATSFGSIFSPSTL